MSLPRSSLEDPARSEIVGFYRDVFGWDEMPTMTQPGRRLVLQAYSYDQFVFLIAEDEPMTAPRMDHFGMAVDTMGELEAFHARAKEIAARDDRVDLIDIAMEDFGVLQLHSFYVRFMLPLMIEVQHWKWVESPTNANSGAK
jgi:hypothetical protein